MIPVNKSILCEVIIKISPVFEEISIDNIASDIIWSIVLGVLPVENKGHEDSMMELSRKDTTAEKIDNIEMITEYAEYIIAEKPDCRYPNLESFSQALRQLIKYTAGDPEAQKSLGNLKELYIYLITSYYIMSVKSGRKGSAEKNIRHFSEKILNEDDELKNKLENIIK